MYFGPLIHFSFKIDKIGKLWLARRVLFGVYGVQVSYREVIAIYLFIIESSKYVSCPACNDREEKLSI